MSLIFFMIWFAGDAFATRTSYHLAHPVGWMYQQPVGETPGWTTPVWNNWEVSHGNVWNRSFTMTDRRSGDVYTYKADFEQTHAVLEGGLALSESWAVAFELPYASRNSGFLDDFIDQFHVLIGSERFLRNYNNDFDNQFIIKRNGDDRLTSDHGEGVGGVKFKLKYWLWQWKSPTPGVCDCGLAFSAQAKVPTNKRGEGLSSGTNNYAGLVHLGIPLWSQSGFWFTGAVSKLGPNSTFDGWPMREWQQMYEMSFDIGVGEDWGLILQGRYESPLMMKEHLDFDYHYNDTATRALERTSSGWNSLVHWRGSQSIGVRWRWSEGSQINFLMIEDWGWGRYDQRGDFLYVNNAPDVQFLTQWHFVF